MLLLALAASALHGEGNSIRLDGGPAWKGLSIRFETKLEPDPGGASRDLGGTVIDRGVHGDVGQRFIDDPAHKRTFGYDVELILSNNGLAAEIRIQPLHDAQHAIQNGWTQFGLPAKLPKYPVISGLRVGDTVAIDLMVNPSTGQKIVDYLTLVREQAQPAHDFSFADVELSLDRPHILVNGKPLAEGPSDAASGPVIWIYVTARGRFSFSLFPNAKLGFQKNGTAAGNILTFHDGAMEFRVECNSPVAPGPGPYNLYVLHEPYWRPRNKSLQLTIVEFGSGDKATETSSFDVYELDR
jgi:hypothetical protein